MLQHVRNSFLELNNILLFVYAACCLPMHPLTEVWVVFTFAIVNNVSMHMGVQRSVLVSAFKYLGCIPGGGVAASSDKLRFNFLRNCCVFHSVLHFCQLCTRVPISPHHHQHLSFSVVFAVSFCLISIIAIQMSVRFVALVCISPMISKIKHHFMFLLAISISLEKGEYDPFYKNFWELILGECLLFHCYHLRRDFD